MMTTVDPKLCLDSERIQQKLPEPRMARAISAYYLRNRSHFAPYCKLRPPQFHEPAAWAERADQFRERSVRGEALHLVLFDRQRTDSSVIGDINFTDISRGAFQACYLGYQLDEAYVGRGLMTEALNVSLGFVFDQLNLHRIMANYVPTNERSGRLLRRLGFSVEGYARDFLFLDGQWKDHILTSLTNARWHA